MFPQRMPVGRPSADAPVSVVGSEFSDIYNRHLSTEGLPPPPGLGALAAYPISPLASRASLVSRPLPPLPDAPLPPIQNDSESEHTLTPDSPLNSPTPTPTPSPTPRPPSPTPLSTHSLSYASHSACSVDSLSYASHSACSVDPTTPTSLVMSRSTRPSLPTQLSMAISRPTLTRSLPSDSYERYTRPRDAPPHPTTRPFSWGLGDVDLLPTISPRRAPSPISSIVTEELSPISRPVSAWLGWSQRRTSNLSRGWSLTPKKKTFQNPVSPHQAQFHPPPTFSSPPSPSPIRHTTAPFLVPIDSTPSSRSSPSFSGHIAATTNHSSATESDVRIAAWLGAARSASGDTHERARPSIYAVLRDDDGLERTLGPWPLPPRRLPIPLPTLPPLIPTPPPPSPIRVYDYPAVAGWSAHHLPLARSPFENPILWKEERKGIFDAMWGVCVAALAYLLALIRRQEGGSASIHTETLPSHGTSAELIHRNVEF